MPAQCWCILLQTCYKAVILWGVATPVCVKVPSPFKGGGSSREIIKITHAAGECSPEVMPGFGEPCGSLAEIPRARNKWKFSYAIRWKAAQELRLRSYKNCQIRVLPPYPLPPAQDPPPTLPHTPPIPECPVSPSPCSTPPPCPPLAPALHIEAWAGRSRTALDCTLTCICFNCFLFNKFSSISRES